MICAPSSSSKCCGIALTVACVPTGIKTGVCTVACGRVMAERRAVPEVVWIWKFKVARE
jgi:hypothetical protein